MRGRARRRQQQRPYQFLQVLEKDSPCPYSLPLCEHGHPLLGTQPLRPTSSNTVPAGRRMFLSSRRERCRVEEVKAEEFTSWTEAAVHTEGGARLAAPGVAAGLRTRGAALAVLHVEGALCCCTKHSPEGQEQRSRNKPGEKTRRLGLPHSLGVLQAPGFPPA